LSKARGVSIEYLYFHYIDKDRDAAELRRGGTRRLTDTDVVDVFGGYFTEVAEKRASMNCYDTIRDDGPRHVSMETSLRKLNTLVIPDEETQFRELGQRLAEDLIEAMYGDHPGVLFIGRFIRGGERYIGLLKLNWVDESYSEYNDQSEEIVIRKLAEELPAAGRFQKGAVFPHPRFPNQFFMKVFQKDHVADYFNAFLGGQPPIRGGKMMAEIRKVALRLSGGTLSTEQSLDLHESLCGFLGQKQRVVDEKAAVGIIHQVLPSIGLKRIREAVSKTFESKGIVNAYEVEMLRATVHVGNLRVFGSYRSLKENFHENKAGKNRHIIDGEVTGFTQE
jgi:hypothetical protein